MLLRGASVHSKPPDPFRPLSQQQVAQARKIAGAHVRNCGAFFIGPEGYEDIESGTFRLNACALASLKQKRPFLLIYKAARADGFPAWCLVGTAKGRLWTLGFPLHDDSWDTLRKMPCERYKIVTHKGLKYLQCE